MVKQLGDGEAGSVEGLCGLTVNVGVDGLLGEDFAVGSRDGGRDVGVPEVEPTRRDPARRGPTAAS